jgi:hypothetical protein
LSQVPGERYLTYIDSTDSDNFFICFDKPYLNAQKVYFLWAKINGSSSSENYYRYYEFTYTIKNRKYERTQLIKSSTVRNEGLKFLRNDSIRIAVIPSNHRLSYIATPDFINGRIKM